MDLTHGNDYNLGNDPNGDQLPILAVLRSPLIPYCTYSTPTFSIPNWSAIGLPVHASHIPQSLSYFSIFPAIYPTSYQPSTITWLNYPPSHLGSDQPSTNSCYPSISSYNNCGHYQSLPLTTSYFGSISSHNYCVSQLASLRSPSSFGLNHSFPIW